MIEIIIFKLGNYMVVVDIFRLNMDVEFTVESFSAYLDDLDSEGSDSTLRLQLDTNTPSQKILEECLLIGLRSLSSQNQHISQVVGALEILLQFGAKWDNSTLLGLRRTPYHIICQCPNDHYELLDKLITSSGGKLVNEQDSSGCTAVMHAVHNKNIKCLRCLIAHGADLNIRCKSVSTVLTTALIDAIRAHALGPSPITRDILNVLLESEVDVNRHNLVSSPIEYAIAYNSIECFEKLVKKDAQFNLKGMWFEAASNRSIDILRSLINLGISENATDSFGRNALHYAVCSGHITVIRYLLEVGVSIITIGKRQHRLLCQPKTCSFTMGTDERDERPYTYNPCLQAISMERLDVVQLLEKYEQQTFQSIGALKCAVRKNSLKIVNYLLNKYNYHLNMEYTYIDMHIMGRAWHWTQTVITEACEPHQLEMVTLLMEHGADPAKKSDAQEYQSALMIAIENHYNELVAHFIRSGVNLDCKLHDLYIGNVLPFENAVIKRNKRVAEMLLHAGCSCGEFSLVNSISTGISSSENINEFQKHVTPEFQKLMIEWDVYKNKVRPLQQMCRKSILHHLCPRAVKEITELPLPPRIIRYLGIPEIEY